MPIRVAKPADAKAIQEIYAPFCLQTSNVSFEIVPPSVEEMEKRITLGLKTYPWLVYESNGAVVGYCYADQHMGRAAYDWDVNVSIYVKEAARQKGIGKRLYQYMFDGLRTLGYFNAYAGVTLPNEPSVALHKSMGFNLIGVYNSVGYKGGAWRDVAWFGLKLQPYAIEPAKPIKFSQLGV